MKKKVEENENINVNDTTPSVNEENNNILEEENTSLINSEENKELSTASSSLYESNLDMMTKIASNEQQLSDIKLLTSSKVTDQLKVFLISQARNELMRVVKLTRFLDQLETSYMNKVSQAMMDDAITLKQYGEVITVITTLLERSNDIVTKVLKDDSLTTILNTTIYTTTTDSATSVVTQLKDPQSRERVRSVINNILYKTEQYNNNVSNTEEDKLAVIEVKDTEVKD